ncbi:hypothetical protein H8N03_14105 [Ramlibacter sp. USB13]|uniref:Uncharacterized protein n=2 Tax=Ramlibacter cellulosilyticus TaxID=2764187 RepID=A0A923MSE8_9BURK|nr:hypothetical protein [Ramlibacter cellulosilyticus]
MRSGLLYMNSLDYFSKLPGEELLPLRKDELETVYGVLRAGPNARGFSKISMKIGESEKEIDLGAKAVITATFPRPKNYMLFCMGAFSDGVDGKITGEVDGRLYFDERFLHFGSHVLLISNAPVFGERISKAIAGNKGIFGSKFFHDGFGLVQYRSLADYSGPKGLYMKDERYSWQRELRIALGAEDHLLNESGALELNIGDISDISQIVSVQALIDEPFRINRRRYAVVDGHPRLIDD